MAWWKLFWNPVEEVSETPEEKFETSAFENVISEPVRSIVKAMMDDRKRFIFQIDRIYTTYDTMKYAVLDIDTEEEFFARSVYYPGIYCSERKYYGPSWAKDYEVEWAVKTLHAHYDTVRERANSIQIARERNRLIEIYA